MSVACKCDEFIRQLVATWVVPGPDLPARVGRMLGFARHADISSGTNEWPTAAQLGRSDQSPEPG